MDQQIILIDVIDQQMDQQMMTSSIIVQNFSYNNKFFARNSKLDSIFATFLRKSF